MFERTKFDDPFYLAHMKLTLQTDLGDILVEYEAMCQRTHAATGLVPVPFSVERIYRATELLVTKSVVIVPWMKEPSCLRIAEQRLDRLKVRALPTEPLYAIACLGSISDVDVDDILSPPPVF